MPDETPSLGEVLHRAREAGNAVRIRPLIPEDWADRDPRLQALDEAMAAAVAAVVRERVAVALEDYAANYPEDMFPPGSSSRDAIGGTAMRHAYRNAARIAREAQDRSDEKEAGTS
jgi:hypothetical protein